MQGKFNLGEEDDLDECGKARRQSKAAFNSYAGVRGDFPRKAMSGQGSNRFPEIPSLDDAGFTISVIEGPSRGLAYEMNKMCITVGRIGGGADFEIDDP